MRGCISNRQQMMWLVAGAIFMGGCAADPASPSASSSDLPLRSVSATDGGHDLVARGIALAMRERAVRHAVRDAMRASLVTEHKLVLQEFVNTPAGKDLVIGAAGALGVSPDAFRNAINDLQLMDFYVPSAKHRKAWRGDGVVFVAAATGLRRSEAVGTRSDGVSRGLSQADWAGPSPVFFLEPAERKSRRIKPQSPGPGATIEDLNDGHLGGSFVEYLPDGTIKVTDLADYFAVGTMEECAVEPLSTPVRKPVKDGVSLQHICEVDGGGGGGIPVPDTTYLEHVIIIDVCDNGMCWQGNEFEWHTYFSTDNGASYGNRFDLRIDGVPSNFEGTYNFPALLKKIRYPYERVKSDVVETDTFSPSDHFNPSPVWDYYNVNGRLKFEGEPRCGYPKPYGGTYDCDGVFFWKEVNQSMRW